MSDPNLFEMCRDDCRERCPIIGGLARQYDGYSSAAKMMLAATIGDDAEVALDRISERLGARRDVVAAAVAADIMDTIANAKEADVLLNQIAVRCEDGPEVTPAVVGEDGVVQEPEIVVCGSDHYLANL